MSLIGKDEFIKAWLIYLKDGSTVLSRRHYESWWEIQDEFGSNFKANRAITEPAQVMRYMKADFAEGLRPFTDEVIEAFFGSSEEAITAGPEADKEKE